MADHKHDHDHDHKHDDHRHDGTKHAQGAGGSCCGSDKDAMCGDIGPVGDVNAKGRSFRVNGLDCAEEVAILNKVLGPEVGGTEHLAFDVMNGRMTVLDSAKMLADDRIIKLIGSTGMSASLWEAESAAAAQAAHLKRQKFFHRAFGRVLGRRSGLARGGSRRRRAAAHLFRPWRNADAVGRDRRPSCWPSSLAPGWSRPRPGLRRGGCRPT